MFWLLFYMPHLFRAVKTIQAPIDLSIWEEEHLFSRLQCMYRKAQAASSAAFFFCGRAWRNGEGGDMLVYK